MAFKFRQKLSDWSNSIAFSFGRKPHVFGVAHTAYTSKGPTTHVSALLKEIKAKKVSGRLGMEFLPNDVKDNGRVTPPPAGWNMPWEKWRHSFKQSFGDDRYALALYKHAKRKNIELVALENLQTPSFVLQNIVRDVLSFREMRGMTLPRAVELTLDGRRNFLNKNPSQASVEKHKMAVEMLEQLVREKPGLSWSDVDDLSEALTVQRSLEMYQNAVSKKLRHVAMGASHAADLRLLLKAPVTFVNSYLDLPQARVRVEKYRALKPLVEKLLAEKR